MADAMANVTGPTHRGQCDGIIIPYWGDHSSDADVDIGLFILYGFALAYAFGGVAVAADIFMGAIEAITAVTRSVKRQDGSVLSISVWNKTVANLSLMALGSSAPEILLAIIGILGNDFESEDLGPGTIVGSAAFNMLVIIAICVSIQPNKSVEEINVLYITAFASVFAYIWLYLIVDVFSPGECELWEALVTIAFFPLLILIAWMADLGWFDSEAVQSRLAKVQGKGEDACSNRLHASAMERVVAVGGTSLRAEGTSDWNLKFRREIRRMIKNNRTDKPLDQIYVDAFETLKHHDQSPNIAPPFDDYTMEQRKDPQTGFQFQYRRASAFNDKAPVPIVGFKSYVHACKRDQNSIRLCITSVGPRPTPLKISWKTIGKTAESGKHFHATKGFVHFPANDTLGLNEEEDRPVKIGLIDPKQHELTRTFDIVLSVDTHVEWIGDKKKTEVRILDADDHTCAGSVGSKVDLFFRSIVSEDESPNAWIEQIRTCYRFGDDDEDDEDDHEVRHLFEVNLEAGAAYLEVQPSDAASETSKDIDADAGAGAGGGDADDDEGPWYSGQGALSWGFWLYSIIPKVVMGIITPPTAYCGGWLTFVFSLGWIALYTAICGDLATGIGCTVYLKDTVTAITFVALGTSVPDTFASKIAAEQDENADPAIGNVTGSNAVNVFLGIGLSWLCGAAYHSHHGTKFEIASGSLASSVIIFSIMAAVWFAILTYRRYYCGGELGGAQPAKGMTILLFVFMWFAFILLVALIEYGHIDKI